MATIGTHYINSALGGAARKGVDTSALLRQAKIPSKPLTNPKARIHADLVAPLYSSIAEVLNDEFMGFTEHPMKVGTFALMAEWASTANTLGELLQRGIRFYNQITNELKMSLDHEDEHIYMTTVFRRPELDFEHFYIEYWHVIWHRFASWYIGRPIKLIGAYINYKPIDIDEFALLFRCPTYQKSKYNRLVFHQSYLEMPLVRTAKDLELFIASSPREILTIPGEDTSLTAQINQLLASSGNQSLYLPGAEEISSRLGISQQTLRRKLAAEGIHYQQIKDNLRRDVATRLLSEAQISIADIAEQLGYREARTFTRAFKEWTGMSPREFRANRVRLSTTGSYRAGARSGFR